VYQSFWEESMARTQKCGLVAGLGLGLAVALSGSAAAQTKTLKMQATWPASQTLYENFTDWAKRVEQLTAGRIKIETMKPCLPGRWFLRLKFSTLHIRK
jgi:TRAP-type mannitol/chloroaromatic compound transport system substrate-binding protein